MPAIEQVLPHLIHVGAILYLICFLFRDQIALRSFAIAGDVAYTLYYYNAAAEPLWEAILWIIPNAGINIVMIILILRDRRMTTLGDDELTLYQNLKGLTPGQFRKLLKIGRWQSLSEAGTLTHEGKDLDKLHFILKGDVEVEKAGRRFKVDPGIFIGELAYLRNKPATATVTAAPGTLLMSWSHAELKRLSDKDHALGQAVAALLSSDLAEKVARS